MVRVREVKVRVRIRVSVRVRVTYRHAPRVGSSLAPAHSPNAAMSAPPRAQVHVASSSRRYASTSAATHMGTPCCATHRQAHARAAAGYGSLPRTDGVRQVGVYQGCVLGRCQGASAPGVCTTAAARHTPSRPVGSAPGLPAWEVSWCSVGATLVAWPSRHHRQLAQSLETPITSSIVY